MDSSTQSASADEENEFTAPISQQQQLAFNTPCLKLSVDVNNKSTSSSRIDQLPFSISSSGTNAIKQLRGELDSSLLQLLPAGAYDQFYTEWNSSKIIYPSNKCIHELFEEQAANTPDAPAVIFGDQKISYSELNKQANQLAHYLRNKGVQQETLVPICIDRSPEMIIGILGILKAGGAYVPIDTKYPLERIAYLLGDTGASIVVCNDVSKIKLLAFPDVDLIELTDKDTLLKTQPSANLNLNLSSNNLAYIIYTSGTTGRPKGVMIENQALMDHCYGVIERAGLEVCKSFALFSPLVFDAGHSIIHSCFTLGACLHILSDEFILDSKKVKNYVEANSIDCIKIVPSRWLSYASLKNIVLPRKVIIFGGEVFPLSILNYLKRSNYKGNVYNHYGPTEVTIGKCIYKVDINKSYHSVPIGKPFSNTRLYVLDDNMQIVPPAIEGELYIAGDGLARGYLNQPGLTDEKFVKDPFNVNTTDRMYKTGDRVMWLSDGNIEYLGRVDEQVKIQGHRIEPGEIEEAILKSGLVQHAVVLAHADKRGNKQLAAYIVPDRQYRREALSDFLRKELPGYMIPVNFIEIETLPLTGNGKINKKKLEDLESEPGAFAAPADEIQEKLAEIWKDLLHMDKISIHDNFFELGGNSIHATALFARIKKKFHKDFTLAAIFRAPTIYELADAIKKNSALLLSSSLVPIQPHGSKPPLFCIHAGGGDILFYGSLSIHLGPDQPFYCLRARGMNGREIPFAQMQPMANYYINEIRKVQPEGPYYLAGYCFGARIAFEMAQQLTREGQQVAFLASINGTWPAYGRVAAADNADHHKKIQDISSKAATHFNNIAQLSLKEKKAYIFKRVKVHALTGLLTPIYLARFKAYELIFKSYVLSRHKAPEAITREFVAQSLYMLQCKYKPQCYSGAMSVFRAPGIYKDPYLGWKSLVKGEIKAVDIPGDHQDRKDIMNEPYVGCLADEIRKFLI